MINLFHTLWTKAVGTPTYNKSEWITLEAAFVNDGRIEVATGEPAGIDLIATERRRQIEIEGWSHEHDDEHDKGEMGGAAIAYIASALGIECKTKTVPFVCTCRSDGECPHNFADMMWGDPWPWAKEYDKRDKHSRLRKLQIAGALVAAEIDRELRKTR